MQIKDSKAISLPLLFPLYRNITVAFKLVSQPLLLWSRSPSLNLELLKRVDSHV